MRAVKNYSHQIAISRGSPVVSFWELWCASSSFHYPLCLGDVKRFSCSTRLTLYCRICTRICEMIPSGLHKPWHLAAAQKAPWCWQCSFDVLCWVLGLYGFIAFSWIRYIMFQDLRFDPTPRNTSAFALFFLNNVEQKIENRKIRIK